MGELGVWASLAVDGQTRRIGLQAFDVDPLDIECLLARRRDPTNRRNHIIELTGLGEQAFIRLRDAAVAFDGRLRDGLAPAALMALRAHLELLRSNVAPGNDGPAWTELIERGADRPRSGRRRSSSGGEAASKGRGR